MSPWLPILLSIILVGLITILLKKPASKLPPGPRSLPIIGNLHMLGSLPHRALHQLSKLHGPIMHLKLGLVPTVVVSSADAAKLFLKTHDAVFCSRPKTQTSEVLSYGGKGMAFSEYGPHWRSMRKLCTLELLTNAKVEMFGAMRSEEVRRAVEEMRGGRDHDHEEELLVDLTCRVDKLVEDMTVKMIFGSGGSVEFRRIVDEALKMAGAFNLNDFVPFLKVLDLQGLGRRMKRVSKELDALFNQIIDEHMRRAKEKQGNHKDFIDILISLMESDNTNDMQLDRDMIKALLLDLLAAGLDSTATTVIWAFAELMKRPFTMKKAQEELKDVIGLHRMVEEKDLVNLEYLNMVIKETLRLHPVAPLLVPRESIQDVIVNDYHIPKKTRLIINAWAIGRDPKAWSGDPEEFDPGRFANSDVDLSGRYFELIPFGAGRRGCPGLLMGLRSVQLVLGQLLHCFDWELPKGVSPCDLDMGEKFGLAVARAKHLFIKPTYRLKIT
ncbi:hypothetical protein Sjap_024409 [Stephania japonica]|uniref:Cytochrome P450 n=1 Tax=Stephania japonica TaxID=461633 RepID=A0AAP0EI47_9MAGN